MKKLFAPKTSSKGIVTGKVFVRKEADLKPSQEKITEEQTGAEMDRFFSAKKKVKEDLAVLAEDNDIFGAHLLIADDSALESGVLSRIREKHRNAEFALAETTEELAGIFEMMDDAYMKERGADVRDVGKRLMAEMKGIRPDDFSEIREPVILVARDLFPSDTAKLDLNKIKAFITQEGGITSHVSIMAKGLGLPALVGVSGILDEVNTGDMLCMDALTGEIIVDPDDRTIAEYEKKQKEYETYRSTVRASGSLPAETVDGRRVTVCANTGSVEEVRAAAENHADGIGLFRSEFLYMDGSCFPSEEEQFEAYSRAAKFCPRELTVRTLDIGGDKELPYFDFGEEENPFLGWRAIRISLDMKEMFCEQLRAILRASVCGKIRIMFPLIVSVEELREARELLKQCKRELESEQIPFDREIQTGVMMETPAAVMMAEELAKEADFFSIGTNDLTQYLLAADRGNKKISSIYNSFHPAVLRAIAHIIHAGHAAGIPVGMCGEFAGDPRAAELLLGMGLDEFSVSSGSMADVRYAIRSLSYEAAQKKAEAVRKCRTVEEVMEVLNSVPDMSETHSCSSNAVHLAD